MNAIAGLWRRDGRTDAGAACHAMLHAQSIAAAEQSTVWNGGEIALALQGHPESRPVVGPNGRFILVADLRIDNREELVLALALPAREAAAMSDAALVMRAWEKWRQATVGRLLGDYAFALWDVELQRLHLVRDPTGQRPLHYHLAKGFVAFASRAGGLHGLAEIPRRADRVRLAHYLTLHPDVGERSFFEGIRRVEPGSYVEVDAYGARSCRHWNPQPGVLERMELRDYPAALREQFDAAVRRRLSGTGRFSAQLSGGLDSGGVVASAASILSESGRRVSAFTAVPRSSWCGCGPANRVVDEGPAAAAVAALYPNVDHRLVVAGPTLIADLERTVTLAERPPLDLFNLGWIHAILDAARDERAAILLTGETGNLSFSYEGTEYLADLVRRGRLFAWIRIARLLLDGGELTLPRLLFRSFGPYSPGLLWRLASGLRSSDPAAIAPIAKALMKSTPGLARTTDLAMLGRPWSDTFTPRLWALSRRDPGNYNMAARAGWGIEVRDPTADIRLIEFCLAVPGEEYVAGGQLRSLARRALFGRLPKAVLDETRRGLQAADWADRLSEEFDALSAEVEGFADCVSIGQVVATDRLKSMLASSRRTKTQNDTATYRFALIRAISAGYFIRHTGG